jgi:sulfur-carrier protein
VTRRIVGQQADEALVDLVPGEPGERTGVALAQARLHHHGLDAQDPGDDRAGLGRSGQVGGDDGVDGADGGRRCGCLAAAAIGERRVGLALPAPVGVPLGFAVSDEEEGGHRDGTVAARMGRARRAPVGLPSAMARLRLFAAARTAAGTATDSVPGETVADVLAAAVARYGSAFAEVLPTCAVWVNGAPAGLDRQVGQDDEVAVLPPVSGGAT